MPVMASLGQDTATVRAALQQAAQPGDILLKSRNGAGHAAFFVGWQDPSTKNTAIIISARSPANGVNEHTEGTSYLCSGYDWLTRPTLGGSQSVASGISTTPASSSKGRDTGIAARLRAAGLNVVEVPGWQTRGSADFAPRGSVDHHTAGPLSGNAPSLNTVVKGRADLPGPLCNVLVARDGTCYVVAAGRANHAGTGGWAGLSGNRSVFGVERENTGTGSEPWGSTPGTFDFEVAAKVHAALISVHGADPRLVCEHKEWAPRRKVDAYGVDGNQMRLRVAYYLQGGT
jgi:hypothetical protein